MQPHDFPRFLAVMNGLGKVYEREIDNVTLDAYWLALRSWSLADFEAAAGQLMRTGKFMPRPADFHEIKRSALPTVGEAWARVLQHCKGGYRDGAGLTPEIDRAVRPLGGYRALAMLPAEEMRWQEKRFAQHYADQAEADERRAALPRMDADHQRAMLKLADDIFGAAP